jgi:hypothetical protein
MTARKAKAKAKAKAKMQGSLHCAFAKSANAPVEMTDVAVEVADGCRLSCRIVFLLCSFIVLAVQSMVRSSSSVELVRDCAVAAHWGRRAAGR